MADIGERIRIEVLILLGHQRLEIEGLGREIVAVVDAGEIAALDRLVAVVIEISDLSEGPVADDRAVPAPVQYR